jgi:hypothetical protein
MPKKDKGIKLGAILLTAIFLLALSVIIVCDVQFNRALTWSVTVAGAMALGYVIFILPAWFSSPNPVIFVPCGFLAGILYLLYINIVTGGNWFLSFAFPVAGSLGVIITAVTTLCHYLRRGYLYILGGGFIALGAWCALIELFIHLTFEMPKHVIWSPYPCATFAVCGLMLIIIGIVKPFRDSLRKIFYVGKM